MSSENQNNNGTPVDSSYGGSKYRLSYDHAVNKKNKKKNKAGAVRTFVVVLSAVILFAVIAVIVLKHYDDAIKKLYSSETTEENEGAEADFQSNVNIVSN